MSVTIPDMDGLTLGEEILFCNPYLSEQSLFPIGLTLFLLAITAAWFAHRIYQLRP